VVVEEAEKRVGAEKALEERIPPIEGGGGESPDGEDTAHR